MDEIPRRVTCGNYFLVSQAAFTAFRETELAKTIPDAYEAKDIPREVHEVLYPLHPERGSIAE